MDNHNNQQDHSKNTGIWNDSIRQTAFHVPSDYFDTLERKVLQRIKVIEEAEKSFALPSDYFKTLYERIRYRIQIEEEVEEENFSFLDSINKSAGFTTPDHYFEKLAYSLGEVGSTNVNKVDKPAPIRKLKINTWISYAAAACVILALGSTLLFRLNLSNQTFQGQLHDLPETEIINYLEYYSEPEDALSADTQLETILETSGKPSFSEEEIEAYLDYSI